MFKSVAYMRNQSNISILMMSARPLGSQADRAQPKRRAKEAPEIGAPSSPAPGQRPARTHGGVWPEQSENENKHTEQSPHCAGPARRRQAPRPPPAAGALRPATHPNHQAPSALMGLALPQQSTKEKPMKKPAQS